MTTLAQVKLNGEYDTVSESDPTTAQKAPAYLAGHRWLSSADGQSFILVDQDAGTWTQIETALDAKINAQLGATYGRVIAECVPTILRQRQVELEESPDTITRTHLWYLNTYVSLYALWDIAGASVSVDDAEDIVGSLEDFEYEDAVMIIGSKRNDGLKTIESVDAAGLTFAETLQAAVDGTDRFLIALADVPVDLDLIIARMVYFDVVLRSPRLGLQSERIGTYSYSLGGKAYPNDVVAGLSSYLSSAPIVDVEYTP